MLTQMGRWKTNEYFKDLKKKKKKKQNKKAEEI